MKATFPILSFLILNFAVIPHHSSRRRAFCASFLLQVHSPIDAEAPLDAVTHPSVSKRPRRYALTHSSPADTRTGGMSSLSDFSPAGMPSLSKLSAMITEPKLREGMRC